MAGRMISELSDATTLQNTDLIPLARGATTLKVSGLTLVNGLTSSASGAFASKTDLTSLSSTVDANFALKTSITSLSSTVDTNFIPKPASASAQQVLTYNGSTTTWVASAAPNGSTGPTSAKAWVNFDGTLATPITPRASYNVSSVTKSGTGVYTINFPVGALADANYSICGTVGRGAGFFDPRIIGIGNTNPTSSAAQVSVINNAGTFEDCEFTMVAIFGN